MKLIIGSVQHKVLLLIFVAAIAYFIFFIAVSGYSQHPLGLYTQIPLILMPILGGIVGWKRFCSWDGLTTIMGRVLFGLASGMFVWGCAYAIWTYYLFKGIAIPYPSIADYVFVFSPVLYIFSLIELSRVVGAPFGLKTIEDAVIGIIATVLVGAISYYILVVVGHGNTLKSPEETALQGFFNYAYTIAILIIITMVGAILSLSRNYFGGVYKTPILLLFAGFSFHFFAIFFFVVTASNGTYFYGNIADALFTFAIYLECLGIINLDTKLITDA